MKNKLCFSTYDPVFRDTPSLCEVCGCEVPAFHYEFATEEESGDLHQCAGFCCVGCSAELLGKLRTAELRSWATEEAALAEDELDISSLRERRLALVGEGLKN
jgi:hypothetical protein